MIKTNLKIWLKEKFQKTIGHWSLVIGHYKKGFTIIELMISTTIMGILIITGASVYTNFYNSVKNLQASNKVYEEARFLMEKIAREIRNGTIDYEEYYNQATNFGGSEISINDTYGVNYCQYSRQFYGPGPDGKYGTYDDESLGERNDGSKSPIPNIIQDKLFLINSAGDNRTYIKKLINSDGLGKIGILKLTGKDYGLDHLNTDNMADPGCLRDSGERDGLIDTWLCDKGFKCNTQDAGIDPCSGAYDIIYDDPTDIENSSFVNITPTTLDIEELKFFITPMDDPYKAYNNPDVQIQPNITIKLIARASPEIAGEFKGKIADIVLESTVSSRNYNQIITSCNLQECINGDKRACPKKPCQTDISTGLCIDSTVAEATCSQGVWPICTDEDYISFVNSLSSGLPDGVFASLEDLNTFYEADNEVGSCNSDNFNSTDIIKCKKQRCSDEFDNDGNGVADNSDPSCVWELCNNGVYDPGVESCLDVGGSCAFRPEEDENIATSCSDGYDNDCDGKADEFDTDCVNFICNDGEKTSGPITPRNGSLLFLNKNYTPTNYLLGAEVADEDPDLSEKCVDIGGLCEGETSTVTIPGISSVSKEISKALQLAGSEKGDFCYDRLDNDCNGTADELDTNCKAAICSNEIKDDQLVNSDYTPENYLIGYNLGALQDTDLDEACVDRGGVCGAKASNENTWELCTNGKDDDCDTFVDSQDTDCCPDNDGDGFSPFVQGLGGPMCNPPDSNPTTGFPPYGKIDCNDNNSSIHPGDPVSSPEICDNAKYPAGNPFEGQPIDNNCSGINHSPNGAMNGSDDFNDITCCVDTDGDGYGIADAGIFSDTSTGKCVLSAAQKVFDCTDTDATANPGITEICDGKDNNCDGKVDENPTTGLLPWEQACYTGTIGTRNVGVCKDGIQSCSAGSLSVCTGEVVPTTETCNSLDDNCNGSIDEGTQTTFYKDNDSDTFGDPLSSVQACSLPSGYVADNTDCDDTNSGIHIGCP